MTERNASLTRGCSSVLKERGSAEASNIASSLLQAGREQMWCYSMFPSCKIMSDPFLGKLGKQLYCANKTRVLLQRGPVIVKKSQTWQLAFSRSVPKQNRLPEQ